MRLPSGKRLGQSSYELALTVFLSFVLHAGIISVALVLHFAPAPKLKLQPVYSVKLVSQPADIVPVPAAAQAPSLPMEAAPPAKPKVPQKSRKAPPAKRLKAAPPKSDMPELSRQKPKPIQPEPARPAPESSPPEPTAQTPPDQPASTAKPASKHESVAVSGTVSTTSGDSFNLPLYYQERITEAIKSNWHPPPGRTRSKAKVEFRVRRSGGIYGDVKIVESNGNDYFDMAVRRAILQSRFPPMPEDFYQAFAVFSVVLQEQE